MPLSSDGKKLLRQFRKQYGDKKGTSIFYAKENKDESFRSLVTKGAQPDTVEWWLLRLLFFKSGLDELDKADGHGGYLVTDSDGNKHLPTSQNGKRSHRLMGAAWAALTSNYRGNGYAGPNKESALRKLKRMYEAEGVKPPS